MRGKDAVLRKAPAYSFGGKDGAHLLGEFLVKQAVWCGTLSPQTLLPFDSQ